MLATYGGGAGSPSPIYVLRRGEGTIYMFSVTGDNLYFQEHGSMSGTKTDIPTVVESDDTR